MEINTNKLNLAMAKACISVNELCKKSGVPRPTFTQIKNGTRNPKPKTVGLIAKALDCEIEYLLEKEA